MGGEDLQRGKKGLRMMKTYNGKEFLTLADFGLNRPPQSWQYVEVK